MTFGKKKRTPAQWAVVDKLVIKTIIETSPNAEEAAELIHEYTSLTRNLTNRNQP